MVNVSKSLVFVVVLLMAMSIIAAARGAPDQPSAHSVTYMSQNQSSVSPAVMADGGLVAQNIIGATACVSKQDSVQQYEIATTNRPCTKVPKIVGVSHPMIDRRLAYRRVFSTSAGGEPA